MAETQINAQTASKTNMPLLTKFILNGIASSIDGLEVSAYALHLTKGT
jgi:hypothetical protein